MPTRTRLRKSFELSRLERLAAPAAALVAGFGGYALEVTYGESTTEGVVTGVVCAAIGGAAGYFLPRLEDVEEPVPPLR